MYDYLLFDRMMFSNILIPIDGSEYADKAFRYALNLAEKYKSKVTLIYVVQRPVFAYTEYEAQAVLESIKGLEEEGKEILKRGKKIAEGFNIETTSKMLKGDPSEEILRLIDEERIDLIVIGSRGLSRVKAFFLGSVSDKVSHHATCPVLIVR